MANLEKIKKLRSKTGASIALINKALSESNGNTEEAEKLLRQWGIEIAEKKKEKSTEQGVVSTYIHHNRKVGAMVALLCQTDFVARNGDFVKLAYEVAMQIASMQPKTADELLKQEYIKDTSITVGELVSQHIAKLGENIRIGEFVRFEI